MDPSVRELERVARQAPSADAWAALARAEARVGLPWRAYKTACRALRLDPGAAVRDLLPAPTELRATSVRWSGLRNVSPWWHVHTGSDVRQVVDAGHGYVMALCGEHEVAVDLFAQRWHVRQTGRRLVAHTAARGHVFLTEWADRTSVSNRVQLVCLDAATGEEVWRRRLDFEPEGPGLQHGVLDAWTTSERWAHVAFQRPSASAVIARIDLDDEDAEPVLMPSPTREHWTSRALAEDGTLLAATNAGRELVRFGPELDCRWTYTGSGTEALRPLGLAAGGWLCLATPLEERQQRRGRSRHGTEVTILDLVRIDDADGREVERRPLASGPRWTHGEHEALHWVLPGPLAINEAVVALMLRRDDREGILALDALTLDPLWQARPIYRDHVRLSATADVVHVFEASPSECQVRAFDAVAAGSDSYVPELPLSLVGHIERGTPLLTAGCITLPGRQIGNNQLIVYSDADED